MPPSGSRPQSSRQSCLSFGAVFAISALAIVGVPTGAAAQTSPPPSPSLFDGRLTPWLQVRLDHRSRVEGVTGSGFARGRDDLYWLARVRAAATVTPKPWLIFVVQGQDARVYGKNIGSQAPPFRDVIDLRLAYVDAGAGKRLTLRAGRQELVFGEQRLVGHSNWTNTARTFDGVRATYRGQGYQIDGFATSVVTIRSGDFNKSGNGSSFFGAYASITRLRGHVLEPYFFWRAETVTASDLEQATLGLRWAGSLPASLDAGVEMAVQRGSVGSEDIEAWAGHGQLARTLRGMSGAPRIIGEYNFASGDSDPADRIRGTFDQLYPTPHDKYGLADQVGWRNIHHLRTGVEIKPKANWLGTGNYHSWWLAKREGLYSAGGSLVARSPEGSAGRHVGQELDGQVVYSPSPMLQIAGGYAYVFPGEFLSHTTAGRGYSFQYLMVTLVFVGH